MKRRMISFDNIKEKDLKKLKKQGYKEIATKADFEKVRLKKDSILTLYNSGKLVLQGKEKDIKETTNLLKEMGITDKRKKIKGLAVGSDETLKGDTFGGIVVVGFKADDKIREDLVEMGVKDSKALDRPKIVKLAKEIIEKYPDNYHIENLFPEDYNELNKKNNVTSIMNKLHKKCFEELKENRTKHIVDLYPGCSVGRIRETEAESKYPEVAAASIIARYEALKQMKELEHRGGFFIPMGSTHVDSALLQISKKSLDPKDFVKLKFKNVKKFFEL